MRKYYVYILSSKRNGTLYIGMTGNITERLHQHKTHKIPGFTARYKVFQLVYVEECPTSLEAIAREKQLKRWKRLWKIDLIEKQNPLWSDLCELIIS